MPFAGYKDFADCVAKNKDKGDPEAYCGSIKNKTEGKSMETNSDEIFYKTSPITFTKGVNAEGKEEKLWRFVLSSTGVDYDDERMTKRALQKAAGDLLEHSTVFFNHKHDGLGVGKIVKTMVEDAQDKSYLYIDVRPSEAEGVKDIVTQVNEGVLKCSSIGGKTLKKTTVFDKSLNKSIGEIDDLIALEGSIVGIGANPDAMRFGKSLFMKSQYASSENGTDIGSKGPEGPEEKEPIVVPKKKKTKDGKEVDDPNPEMKRQQSRQGYDDKYSSIGDAKMTEETKVEVEKDARLTGSGVQAPAPNNPPLVPSGEAIEGAKKLMAQAMSMLSGQADASYGTPNAELQTHSSGAGKSVSVETEARLVKMLDKLEGMNLGAPAGLVKKEEKFDGAPEGKIIKVNQTMDTSANENFKKMLNRIKSN